MFLGIAIAISTVPCFGSSMNNHRMSKGQMYKNFCVPKTDLLFESKLYRNSFPYT